MRALKNRIDRLEQNTPDKSHGFTIIRTLLRRRSNGTWSERTMYGRGPDWIVRKEEGEGEESILERIRQKSGEC